MLWFHDGSDEVDGGEVRAAGLGEPLGMPFRVGEAMPAMPALTQAGTSRHGCAAVMAKS